jgi:hypothetical protein
MEFSLLTKGQTAKEEKTREISYKNFIKTNKRDKQRSSTNLNQ